MTVFNHVGQCTANLQRSRQFYVELLGFTVEREIEVGDDAASRLLQLEPPVGLRALYLRRGAFVLELLSFDRPGNPEWSPRVFNEPGLTHLSFSVEDLDASVERVRALGGEIVSRVPGAVMVRDPDGQLLELLPPEYRQHVAPDESR